MRALTKKLFLASLVAACVGLGGVCFFITPGDPGVSYRIVNRTSKTVLTWVTARDCSQLIGYRHEYTREEAILADQTLDYRTVGEGNCIQVATADRRVFLARNYDEGAVITVAEPIIPLTDPLPPAAELPTKPPGVSSALQPDGPVFRGFAALLCVGVIGSLLGFVLWTGAGLAMTYKALRKQADSSGLSFDLRQLAEWVTGWHMFATGAWIMIVAAAVYGVSTWLDSPAVHFTVSNNSGEKLVTWFRSGACHLDGRGAAVYAAEEVVVPGQTIDYSQGSAPGCIYVVSQDRKLILVESYHPNANILLAEPLQVLAPFVPPAAPGDVDDSFTRGDTIVMGLMIGGIALWFPVAPAVAFTRKVRQDNSPRPAAVSVS